MFSECEMFGSETRFFPKTWFLYMIMLFLSAIAYGVWGSEAQFQGEQVILTTVDGVKIRGFEIATGKDTMLVYCHRLLGSKDSFDLIRFGNLLLREFDVLAFDFRGHKLRIEVGQINHLTIDGNHQVTSEQIQQVLKIAEGHYYNAWEIETAVKRLNRFPILANAETQLRRDANGNTVKILVKERRPWSLGLITLQYRSLSKLANILVPKILILSNFKGIILII